MGRDREHLTELEVDRLMKAAKGNRHGQRDASKNKRPRTRGLSQR
jgi:hypothetical protein